MDFTVIAIITTLVALIIIGRGCVACGIGRCAKGVCDLGRRAREHLNHNDQK